MAEFELLPGKSEESALDPATSDGEKPSLLRSYSKKVENGQVLHTFQGKSKYGQEVDIPEDAYGAAVLCIVKEFTEIRNKQSMALSYVRCIFALGLLATNITMQALMLWFIQIHVVNPHARNIQLQFKDFHAQVFDEDGNFQDGLWKSYEGKDELCQIALSNRIFLYCVLLLWTSAMMCEFRNSQRMMTNVFKMPLCGSPSEMLWRGDDGAKTSIVALTKSTRLILYLFVCVPKLAICCFLLSLGWRWLSATSSFEDLVMNTVAMEFVIHVDELLYHFAVPQTYRRLVSDIDFWIEQPQHDKDSAEKEEWVGYFRSGGYILITFFLVIFYVEVLQDLLPAGVDGIQKHCHSYLQTIGPMCSANWLKGEFRISASHCFPYGVESDGD